MGSDAMRVRLHLRQIRVLAVPVDTPGELVVEVESTVGRPRCAACGFRCTRVHDTRGPAARQFPAPTCVLKGSDDDDVEDRRHDPCCASDGGRSSGVAVQAEIPNHRRLRRLRAGVVSAAGDVSLLAGRVCDEKTNMCEPLLTHRNETTMASKLGSVGGPGTKARLGGPSVGELPVCGPGGARCIGGVSSLQALAWNRRTCRPDGDGRCFWPREGEPQAANTASGRVPMRGTGADRPVVAVRAL